MKALFTIINNMDRRYIFLAMVIAVILPLIKPLALPVKITPNTQSSFDVIDSLAPGSKILLSFDYDPASSPELQPMAKAVMTHCFRKDVKMIAVALWPQGPMMAKKAFESLSSDPEFSGKKYGVDFVNLGVQPSYVAVVKGMGDSIAGVFPTDFFGNKTTDFEIMKGVKNYRDLAAIFSLTTGSAGIGTYVTIANAQYKTIVTGGCTAISSLEYYPYLQSKQLIGLVEGLKGASEYERLVKKPALATAGMDVQAVVHMMLIFFILLANVSQMIVGKQK
ncbi:MAG TPA: hypothetical protein PKW98_07170 [Candidatus Wallbacteria bacterium]|nr:MAG: hypothetical protein BWY32_01924 [bacterium ADurb.Bin243]HOD42698.1 hypothetical protein [Candidatus Wallbacteria bacterium]HPG57581.1 hypothetical protein [Candidatus Wallbacteria bacterium]